MTNSVTFPVEIGGDGSTVTDGNDSTTGLGNGGHRTRFVPAMGQVVAVAEFIVDEAATASAEAVVSAEEAADSAASAAASALDAATIVSLGIDSPGVSGTSTTSMSISLGTQTWTMETGKSLYPGMASRVLHNSNNYMSGMITAYNSGTGVTSAEITNIVGSGTYSGASAWTIGPNLYDAAADALIWAIALG